LLPIVRQVGSGARIVIITLAEEWTLDEPQDVTSTGKQWNAINRKQASDMISRQRRKSHLDTLIRIRAV